MDVSKKSRITKERFVTMMEAVDTDRFYIEYTSEQYRALFNHTACGSISLYRLGASQRQVEDFQEDYVQRLQTKDAWVPSAEDNMANEDIAELRGKERGFYRLVQHYTMLLDQKNGSLEALIKEQFPTLMPGMIGAAFHGLIHTGYGYSEGISRVVCEGLAFLDYIYSPLVLSESAPPIHTLGSGDLDILDVLVLLKEDRLLTERMFQMEIDETERRKRVGKTLTYFEHRADPLVRQAGDSLARYVHMVKFPSFYDKTVKSTEQIKAMLKWVIDCGYIVYLTADRQNDFFLLHGVTSSWALRELLSTVHDYTLCMKSVRVQLCLLFATYLVQLSPSLDRKRLQEPDIAGASWDDIRARTLRQPIGTDEHVYKLVQISSEMSLLNCDPGMEDVYKRAALTVLSRPLVYI